MALLPYLEAAGDVLSGIGAVAGAFGSSGESHYNPVDHQWLQLDYDRRNIEFKTRGAREAGIHPLYALGSTPLNIPPQQVGGRDTAQKMGQALSGVGSAMSNYSANKANKITQALQAQQMQANIEETDARTRKIESDIKKDFAITSGLASVGNAASNLTGRSRSPKIINSPFGPIDLDPNVDDTELYEARVGDVPAIPYGLATGVRDLTHTYKKRYPNAPSFKKSMQKNRRMYKNKTDPWSRASNWIKSRMRSYNKPRYDPTKW